MTVKEFLDDYNNNHELDKHIVKKYIPYAEKISWCDLIIKSSCYEKVSEDKQIFKINSPTRQMLLSMTLIRAYTDIEVDNSDILSDYDNLTESGLLMLIIDSLPEDEVNRWYNLIDMCLDDLMTNTRDLVSYIDTKVQSYEMIFGKLYETMINSEEGKSIINSLGIGEVLPK